MGEICQNCGRELEDGESQSADGCQFCAGRDDENNEKRKADSGGSAILVILLLAGAIWLAWRLIFGWFLP